MTQTSSRAVPASRIWNENGDLVATQEDQKLAGPAEDPALHRHLRLGVYMIYRAVLTSMTTARWRHWGVQKFAVSKVRAAAREAFLGLVCWPSGGA